MGSSHRISVWVPVMGLGLVLLAACGHREPVGAGEAALPVDERPWLPVVVFRSTTGVDETLDRLLDGDETTCWLMPAGTGPEEGIHLTFFPDREMPIREIRYFPPDTSGVSPVERLQVFADGRPAGILMEDHPVGFSQAPKSLFLRIDAVAGEQEQQRELDGALLRVRRFPLDGIAGLAELRFYDDAGKEFRLEPPRRVTGEIRPSSNLGPVARYHAGLLFDGQPGTAWLEGAVGPGTGEQLLFLLDRPLRINGLMIWNGCQQSAATFGDYPRLKSFTLGSRDTLPFAFALPDSIRTHRLSFPDWLEDDTLELRITDVYPGRKYYDLAISELIFLEGDRPFVVNSGLGQLFREERRALAGEGLLRDLQDRRLFNRIESVEVEFFRRQSLLLRSDGTFSASTEEWSEVDNASFETLINGTWDLLRSTPVQTVLRLQGRQVRYLPGTDGKMAQPYSFTDLLFLEDGVLRGERYLELYYLY